MTSYQRAVCALLHEALTERIEQESHREDAPELETGLPQETIVLLQVSDGCFWVFADAVEWRGEDGAVVESYEEDPTAAARAVLDGLPRP
jgi:hypothetical protein